MRFISHMEPPPEGQLPSHWFIYQRERLLVQPAGETVAVPLARDLSELGLTAERKLYLGYLQDEGQDCIHCFGAEIAPDASLPEGMIADGLRQLFPQLGETFSSLAGRAVQIVAWDRTNRYCGQCGARTEDLPHERAKRCPACGLTSYPRLSPAIIIAVVRRTGQGKRLLLARNHRFPPGRYSVLAGYVEPGETLEECAHREVLEETGIRIGNVRYFGSQPWPFPNSLMIGFTAEYDGGEITLDGSELAEASWFAADALPNLPPKFTIARQLIGWFVEHEAETTGPAADRTPADFGRVT